jgi:hypothetical protein|tara:strand:- start:28153 stop:28869 length:717 start_codon:yes stop_codon:yes gene_type:complete
MRKIHKFDKRARAKYLDKQSRRKRGQYGKPVLDLRTDRENLSSEGRGYYAKRKHRFDGMNDFDGKLDSMLEHQRRFDGGDIEELHGFTDFDGDVENNDMDFDTLLSKRGRARRKERRKLRKGGMSRKEARKTALAMIPRQKVKEMVQEVATGNPSPSTQKLIDSGTLSGDPSLLSQQVQQAVGENLKEGTQNTSAGQRSGNPPPSDDGGKKGGMSMLMMIGVGALALGGIYFLMRKKK